MKMIHNILAECTALPKADNIIPGDGVLPTSHLSLSLLQIDWPAPQDKKRECVAKGKNNQVTWVLAGRVSEPLGLPAMLKGTMAAVFKTVVYENNITHFTLLNYILSSQSGLSNWKLSSHYISTR